MSDVRALYADLGIDLPQRRGTDVPVRCFANPEAHRHDDRRASCSVSTVHGAWNCWGCGASGGAYDAALSLGKRPVEAMELLERHGLAGGESPPGPHPKALNGAQSARETRFAGSEADVKRHREAFTDSQRERLRELRGYTQEAIDQLELGLDGERIVFPTRDPEGSLVGLVRYQPNSARRNGGSKSQADAGSIRGLFPAIETIAGDEVWVTEGEPDAVAAHSLGLPGVAVPGTNSWRAEWAERFAGRRVVVVLDCDAPGREAAQRIAAELGGHAAEVRVLDLDPARENGHDLGDLLLEAAEHGPTGLVDLRRVLERMAESTAPLVTPDPRVEEISAGHGAAVARRVRLTPASAITPEALRWLWRDRLPLRALSLVAGEPGLGKSTLTAELAARVTRGQLEGDLHGRPADVLIATAEDHFASVVWGRLMAAGADLGRVHQLHVEGRDGEELLTLPDDVAEIGRRCSELAAAGRPVGLVSVDPVAAFIGGSVDTHRDAAVRRVLAPLAGLAEREQLAVVGIVHLNKDTAAKLLARVGGSVAFGAAPRSVLAFARHPDDPNGDQGVERVLVHAKTNHGRYAATLAARIEARDVDVVGSVARLVVTGESAVGPDDLGAQPGGDNHDRDAAAEWLADELADGRWQESRDVKARAKAAGHAERTVQRARISLGVEDRREGFPAVSEWRLPVVPTLSRASGTTVGDTTEQTRVPERNLTALPSSRGSSPDRGTTGDAATPLPSTYAEEAEVERARQKFPDLTIQGAA